MMYAIFPTTVYEIDICPANARKSVDGTKWICHNPELAPEGVEAIQSLTHEEAKILMGTEAWSVPE